jgi:hypothetical protein
VKKNGMMKCKQRYWAGQNHWIYDKEVTALFLHDHINHPLEFIDSDDACENEELYDYADWEGDSVDDDGTILCSSCGCEGNTGKSCVNCGNVFRKHIDDRIRENKRYILRING